MAKYPVINEDTGEQKEVEMSVHEWDKWREDNPEWKRDYSDPSTCPGLANNSDWRNTLLNKHPGWGEVMKGVKKAAPTNKSISEKY